MSRTRGLLVPLVAVCFVVLLLSGCGGNPATPAGSSSTNAEAPAQSETPASSTAPKGVGGWLDEIPAYMPPFRQGDFVADDSYSSDVASVFDNRVTAEVKHRLLYLNVTADQVNAYLDRLRAAGFVVEVDEYSIPGNVDADARLKELNAYVGLTGEKGMLFISIRQTIPERATREGTRPPRP
jgi:hypothetical protein